MSSIQPGWLSPEKGVRGCAALKTPFSCLSCHSQDPWQLRHKSIHRKKNVTFPLKSKHFSENCDNFQLQKLKLTAIFVKKLEIFCKISVLKPLFLMKIRLQAPTFMAIYPLTSPKFRNPCCTYLIPNTLSIGSDVLEMVSRIF